MTERHRRINYPTNNEAIFDVIEPIIHSEHMDKQGYEMIDYPVWGSVCPFHTAVQKDFVGCWNKQIWITPRGYKFYKENLHLTKRG